MTLVTVQDCKALGYCGRGLRRWFSRRDDIAWTEFRDAGVSADWLRATGDAVAIEIADRVEADNDGQ